MSPTPSSAASGNTPPPTDVITAAGASIFPLRLRYVRKTLKKTEIAIVGTAKTLIFHALELATRNFSEVPEVFQFNDDKH